mgnify:CR=1 FL=1
MLAAKTDLNKSARGRTPDAMPREHRAALPRLRALRGNGRWNPFRGFGISLNEKREKFIAISPVLLCLGRDWVANFCRLCLKSALFIDFVYISRFIVDFVNFLQSVFLGIVRVASVHAAGLNVLVVLVSNPLHYNFGVAPAFFMANVLGFDEVDKLFNLVMVLLGFYVLYAFQSIFDATFYGLGKTNFMLFESIVTNSVYYGGRDMP